jgi:hypothetical protein
MSDSDNDKDNKVLFVFYSFGEEKNNRWTYGKFPNGWNWTGKGHTIPCGPDREKYIQEHPSVLDYPREEQFNGPAVTQKSMKEYLDVFFKKLKMDGIVKKYKIRNSYKP